MKINLKYAFYKGYEEKVLQDFSMDIQKGNVISLLGKSGCGKSTLLKIIAGVHTDYEGQIKNKSFTRIMLMPQKNSLLPWKTVLQNVMLLKKIKEKKVCKESALKLLEELELDNSLVKKYPSKLSGGQYQRVALASVLFYEPDLLLLDEPFSALDVSTKESIYSLFKKLQEERNITTLLVTHNPEEAKLLSDVIIKL